jgi:adenylate kinase family enzyme
LRRIAVIGGSCCGKTTLAKELARRLGVTHIEIDALHHDAGWTEAPAEVLQARVDAAMEAAPEGWVADGNYHAKIGVSVLERADTLIFLDLPQWTALRRVVWRTASRALTGEELWNGNRETFRNSFLSRQGIVWWVVTQHGKYRKTWPERYEALPHLEVVRLRSARAVRRWLQSIQATDSISGSSSDSERQNTPPFADT